MWKHSYLYDRQWQEELKWYEHNDTSILNICCKKFNLIILFRLYKNKVVLNLFYLHIILYTRMFLHLNILVSLCLMTTTATVKSAMYCYKCYWLLQVLFINLRNPNHYKCAINSQLPKQAKFAERFFFYFFWIIATLPEVFH